MFYLPELRIILWADRDYQVALLCCQHSSRISSVAFVSLVAEKLHALIIFIDELYSFLEE